LAGCERDAGCIELPGNAPEAEIERHGKIHLPGDPHHRGGDISDDSFVETVVLKIYSPFRLSDA
jgi:hypothetical protein